MYGITEAGIFGMECEQHRMHALDDTLVFEVVDDDNRPVPAGETGQKMLLINLWMRTQPIIRYEIDDMLAVSSERCPCGRPYPVLQTVEGRQDDILRLPAAEGGEVSVHLMHFRSPLAKERAVRQYEVVHRDDEILVRIVAARDATAEDVERRVSHALRSSLASAGAGRLSLRVELVDVIERDAQRMSKLKLVRSERRS